MENAFKVTLFEKLKKHHGNIQSSFHQKFQKKFEFSKKNPKISFLINNFLLKFKSTNNQNN